MDRTRPPVLVTRRLPQEALDRIVARYEMTLYDGQGAMPRDRLLAEVAAKEGRSRCLPTGLTRSSWTPRGPS